MSVTASEVVAAARSYTGVRWVHQGRNRAGLDCVGLIIRVAHDLGLSEFDATGYGTSPNGDLGRALREQCIVQSPGTEPAPAMVAEIRFELEPQHVALIVPYHLGGLGLLHALSRFPRRVTEHRLDADWRRRITGLYCLPGVEY